MVYSPRCPKLFFQFWKEEKFRWLTEGFSVYKEDGEWYLSETQISPIQFKAIGVTKKGPPPVSDFILPDYDILDESGLRPWQSVAAGRLVSSIKEWGAAIDGSDCGCHVKGQLILMSDGCLKKVEDIVVGDVVMGWKGPQTVMELKRGSQQMVKVIPTKGSSFIVNIDHILTCVVSCTHKSTGGFKKNKIIDIKISEFLNLSPTTRSSLKLFSVGCSWPETIQPISPYILGCLLGDGGLSSRSSITFTSNDLEIWKEIENECSKFGWELGKTNQTITKRIINTPHLFNVLRNLKLFPINCENRFIPSLYKICSRNQRLEILAGILDTDGYYRNAGYDFVSKSEQLAKDVFFISKSLGLQAVFKPIFKKCYNNGKVGVYYNVSISGECDVIPCRLPRKISAQRKINKDVTRVGFQIELLTEDNYYGFSLDGDGRFLSDEFVVFHNTGKTYTSCAVVRDMGMNMVVICPKAVISTWNRVINDHFRMG
jgi:hypothetical protein